MTQASAASPNALTYPFDGVPAGGEVRAVAPGVGWIRMPLPFALDHINLWLLDDGEALTVVDTGFGLDPVRAHWETILARDTRPLSRIVVTHCHPDHLGLASWLAERDGAPITMTQGEFLAGHAIWNQMPGSGVADMLAQFRANGLDDARLEALQERGNGYRRGVPALPSSYHRLFDGSVLRIGDNDWRVIVGYGHAPEHASLYCETLGVLISGDMLLPRISTNVSVYAATPNDDPLGWFLDSLQRIKDLPDDTLVLPSHGHPFRGIRARIAQLEAHHRERCDALLGEIGTPRSAGELLSTLFPRELDTHQVMFAMGEAIAHLNYLVARDEARKVAGQDGIIRFARRSA
ncbi:MBL fold metallo-hydrolase [Azoarcus sp. KH32C]|uniref:MBL fold metallo-hydrolase n=1 Tax=Azoarcus sp. KH32C TaxID=748247 RepID=UPI0002386F8C|nr:MBL fold metallo-hydrolase [Azoarcus sp. KH32C]BAL22854.1 putative metallo-beta-lactamase family protein [Azoarcus sp. KH32C]